MDERRRTKFVGKLVGGLTALLVSDLWSLVPRLSSFVREVTMRELIDDFLSQRRIAIVGVTRDEKGWGRALYDQFKKRGYDTYAVNPTRAIPGIQCYAHLRDIPRQVDGVLLVVPPAVTEHVVREVAELKVPRVWMHRGVGTGAVSRAAVKFCKENGIKVIYGVCPMMYLAGSGIGHRLHHGLAKWRKQLPEDA